MEDDHIASQSLKHKLKQSLCLSCCFPTNRREALDSPSSSSSVDDNKPRLIRASSTWLKSRAHDLPEIRDRCRHLMSRIGRNRSHSPSDFRYDPLSYALNFDGGGGYDDSHLDEAPLRNFSSRLQASASPPPPVMAAMDVSSVVVVPPPVAVSREIAAYS